jgi:hypothetical protein
LFAAASSVYVTWPQALVMSTMAAAHQDVEFSIWRLQWIAHALITSPSRLFDPDIFHPAAHALAYSDATLLEGLVAAPFLWAHVPPLLVYNLLLLAGFAGSGLAMFVLVRHLTGSAGASIVAAAIFTMAPYRIEHFMHLELQWTMFVPLTVWALHRSVDTGSAKFGVLAGTFLWLQVLSCIYYGVFLAMLLLVFAPMLILGARSSRVRPAITAVLAAAGVSIALTLPYALPYRAAAHDLGVRDAGEIARYSATLTSYVATSNLNLLWGWTADRFGAPELRLSPGVLALVLAALSWAHRPRRVALVYLVAVIVAIELSFGSNGLAYQAFAGRVALLQGLRSWSRLGIVAEFGIAVLSGFGALAILQRIPSRSRTPAIVLLVALAALEYGNRPMALSSGDPVRPPDAYAALRRAPAGTLIDLPVPRLDRLPGWEPYYEAWQAWHWRPLVNGYSGYYPVDYLETLIRMTVFPDDTSIRRLRERDVSFVMVHRAFYDADEYTRLMLRIARRPELKPWGTFKDSVGLADIFELSRVE